jgi:hypothetical protein
MRRFFIAIIISIALFACRSGVPKDIIQQAEMENVLFDIHVVDGYATIYAGATNDSLKKIIAPYYKGVYKKYGIDSALYRNSLDYYYNHPKLLKNMYESVTKRLTRAKDKIVKDEEKAALKIVKDEKKAALKIVKDREKAAKKAAVKIAKEMEIVLKKVTPGKVVITKKAALGKEIALKKAAQDKATKKK